MERDFQFQYQNEERDLSPPSVQESEKYLFLWIFSFLAVFAGVFLSSYIKMDSSLSEKREIQSLHQIGMEPFLIRVLTSTGFSLSKVSVNFFASDIRVKKEIYNSRNKYKELLIFLLSNSKQEDLSISSHKEALEEKVKNHINSFLSTGQIQQISINSQFI